MHYGIPSNGVGRRQTYQNKSGELFWEIFNVSFVSSKWRFMILVQLG